MTLDGKKFAVLVEDQYEDQELWYPVQRLREAGAEVTLVGPVANKTYQSKHGYPAKSDAAASDLSAKDFDGVIIPGGYAPDRMRRDQAMVNFVRSAFSSDKIVAAICHGGWMLCSADILKGKEVTSFSAIRDDLVHAGANWTNQEVVQDGRLITSRTPDDLPAFMRTILAEADRPAEVKQAKARARHAG